MTHEERAREWLIGWAMTDSARDQAFVDDLAEQFAEVERKAFERAAREALLQRTAEIVNIPSSGMFNRALERAHDVILALKVRT